MSDQQTNRRTFLRRGLAAGAGVAAAQVTALGRARTLGANDRVNIALIGCGGRGRFILTQMARPADPNLALAAVCDIWKSRLAACPDETAPIFGTKPRAYADYRRLLEDADVDAVIVATPDHQHAAQAMHAVQAGKHVYVEKPIVGLACDLGDLNRLYDAVKAAPGIVLQSGTHGVSCPAVAALKQLIARGTLGRLFRIEGTETLYRPYWVGYAGPRTAGDTDWKAFLHTRQDRPFNPDMHARWMGYKEITSGTIGGWMTHFTNTVHYVTGCGMPISAVAWGGRYAPTNLPDCTAADQTMVILDYAEGFHTQFTSHFGSEIANESITFMFEKGCVRTRFGHHIGNPLVSSEGVNDDIKPYRLLDVEPPYPGAAHVRNWLDCIRNGGQPNANIEFTYKQGVAVAMGDLAWDLGRPTVFDKGRREVKAK